MSDNKQTRRDRIARDIDPPAFDLGETVDLREGRQARAYSAADRVIASDAAAGDDPEALYTKLREALGAGEKWYLERDEARAKVERLTTEFSRVQRLPEMDWATACAHILSVLAAAARAGGRDYAVDALGALDEAKTYVNRVLAERDEARTNLAIVQDQLAREQDIAQTAVDHCNKLTIDLSDARAEIERLKAEIAHFQDPAMQPSQRYWEARWRDADAALTASVAREAVLREALDTARCYVQDAVNADGGIDNCEIGYRIDLERVQSALVNPSLAAEAMVRVVEAARTWGQRYGNNDAMSGTLSNLLMALRNLDALTGEVK